MIIIGVAIAALVLFLAFDLFLFKVIVPGLGAENPYTDERLISGDFAFYLLVTSSAFTYHFNRKTIKQLKTQNEKEKSLIQKELIFLKSQFNSHITMNFLNYCYYNVRVTLPDTADAIELFSTLLRYSLHTKPDEKIPISKEIEYIENYILLQRLLTTEVFVDIKREGCVDDKQILPRILITLVENAFKHGQFNSPDTPVIIKLLADNNRFTFRVENYKKQRKSRLASGIGFENMKKILELFYQNQYSLDVSETKEHYSCSLTLHNTAL